MQSSFDSAFSVASQDGNGSIETPKPVPGGPTIEFTGYSTFVIGSSKKFLYAMTTGFSAIRVYSFFGPGVQLQTGQQFLPKDTSRPLNSINVDPTERFLYLVESPGIIEQFSVDKSAGTLTNGVVVTEPNADLRMTVITPSGKFLFGNDLTLGRIFAYAIGSNGALSPVTGSPFAVPAGGQPTRLAMDSTGQYLYASLLTDGVAAFKIDGSTGSLVDVPGSPFLTSGQPSGIAVSSSNFVYITSSVAVDGFKADAVGTLSPVSGSPFQLSSSSPIVDATGQFLYVIGSNSTIYGFKIDPTSGAFNAISGSPFTSVQNPWLLTPLKIP